MPDSKAYEELALFARVNRFLPESLQTRPNTSCGHDAEPLGLNPRHSHCFREESSMGWLKGASHVIESKALCQSLENSVSSDLTFGIAFFPGCAKKSPKQKKAQTGPCLNNLEKNNQNLHLQDDSSILLNKLYIQKSSENAS